MKITAQELSIPMYLKLADNQPWPEDKVFYYLAQDGMFLCRNNPFFTSSVKTTKVPKGLAKHDESMIVNFPIIRKDQFEQVIGFFDSIWKLHNSEAVVLLIWNTAKEQVEIICPKQNATVGSGYTDWQGKRHKGSPFDVKYDMPLLSPDQMMFGDIHSHVEGTAYASGMDTADEKHKPGIHIVVGRINNEPPQFHIEATVDGQRFSIKDLTYVMEGYDKRMFDFPEEWIGQLSVTKEKPYTYPTSTQDKKYQTGYQTSFNESGYGSDYYYTKNQAPDTSGGWRFKDGIWTKEYKEPEAPKKGPVKNKQDKFWRKLWKNQG